MEQELIERLRSLSISEKHDCINELRHMIDEELAKAITMRGIDLDLTFKIYASAAAEVFNISDIMERKRTPRYVTARAFVMKMMRDNGVSTLWIGDRFGMGHSNVMHATQTLEYNLMSGGDEQEFDIIEMWQAYQERIKL